MTYHLYLSLTPGTLVESLAESGKFLLSAKRTRRIPYKEYIISMDADNISRSSSTYIGKLREEEAKEEQQPLVLRNKLPRWHEALQCWCLNFKGRVTVASVKNFQLMTQKQLGEESDDGKVILQFGKVDKDVFTMDYSYPLSAFQAFAICLTSFDS